jgi:hypothetical protein
MRKAAAIVGALLETGVPNAKDFIASINSKRWDEYTKLLPEFKRSRYGYELVYGNWMFQVYFYPGGKTLWSAFYKTPAFDWDSPKEQKQGWSWGGGADIKELPPGANLADYANRLKKMADKHPEVWGKRYIPHMPDPESRTTYGY